MAKLGLIIHDITTQIANIQLWTQGKNFEDFYGDPFFRNAVERSIEIISEASRRIPENEKARFPDIPWPDIANIGNILRHEYHDANEKIIWEVTQQEHLSDLEKALSQMDPETVLTKKKRKKKGQE